MKAEKIVIEETRYRSDVIKEIITTDSEIASVIEWADANPQVWKIVMGTRSKAFGRKSSEYLGCVQNSNEPIAILERVRHFHTLFWTRTPHQSIFVWRAQFTFDHYGEKGFKGGFFQQFDEKYSHNCLTLDYTPETFAEVLDRFEAWMDQRIETVRITVDGKIVRTFDTETDEG